MKSCLSSNLSEGSLGLELWLLPTPLAGILKFPTASQALLVPGNRLLSFTFLLEISFLPGKTRKLTKSLVLQVTRTCVEHLTWEEDKRKRVL